MSEPKLILADEPTGNLDTANGDAVMDMLSAVTAGGTTLVMVTHSEIYGARADQVDAHARRTPGGPHPRRNPRRRRAGGL